MDENRISGRKHNEAIKVCADRRKVLGDIFHKTANRIYKNGFVTDFLVRGPTLFKN